HRDGHLIDRGVLRRVPGRQLALSRPPAERLHIGYGVKLAAWGVDHLLYRSGRHLYLKNIFGNKAPTLYNHPANLWQRARLWTRRDMTKNRSVVIFGVGDMAEVAHHYFVTDSNYDVVGFTVDRAHCDREAFQGLPVVAFDEVTRRFPPTNHDLFVAVGY